MTVSPRLFIELAPFLGMIIIESTGTGFRSTFSNQLDDLEQDSTDTPTDRDRIENCATVSEAIASNRAHFGYSLLVVFIVFSSKAISQPTVSTDVVTFGIIAMLAILGLMRHTTQYLLDRSPSKYWVSDCIEIPLPGRRYPIHYGQLGVVVANLVPVVFLLYLNLR